jgi:CheY-like chemotaxis protein
MLGHPILVRSRAGRGSLFAVRVPLAPGADGAASVPPGSPALRASTLADVRVLCIDNESDILEGMQLLLERWGCVVHTAHDRAEAERILEHEGPPEIVLADYHLDEPFSGLQLVANLSERFGLDLPVIVVTADRSGEVESSVNEQGYGLLRKPIRPAALRSLMTHMLNRERVDAANT